MGYTCCVPGCRTGYKKSKKFSIEPKVPLYKFPDNPEMKQRWIRSIPRQGWTLSNHKVCRKHFSDDDFTADSSDSNTWRRDTKFSPKLTRPHLKSTAVPHIFPTLPHYLSKPNSIPRSTNCSASARLAQGNNLIESINNDLFLQESVDSMASLKVKIHSEPLPSGYVMVAEDNILVFHYMEMNEDFATAPKILASVIVKESLELTVFVQSCVLPHHIYHHITSSNYLKSTSELSNILSLCKSLCNPQQFAANDNTCYLNLAMACLERYTSIETDTEAQERSNVPLIQFVIEQLKLIQAHKYGRRYSVDVITTAFLWQLTSSTLYRKLQNLFILPSIGYLRKLSTGMNVEPGQLDLGYLKSRTSDLSEQEKIVTLMIDEVYTAQRIEYTNGSFIGVTEDANPAKTVLAFMVQSLTGKYKDVVCLIPVDKLDTALLRKWFDKVMEAINEFLLVIAVSTDNHVCNRKLFHDLCNGNLHHCIKHPFRRDEKLFLIFDFTNNMKNIYNHFVNKKRMHPPSKNYEHILGESCVAEFGHIIRLYALEEDKTLKIAFKLKKVSLNPSSIARTSPQHALNVFCESTVRGLKYFGEQHPAFKKTACYVEFIERVWEVMSVKSSNKSKKKRNPFFMVLQEVEGGNPAEKFLNEAINIFKEWQRSGNSGLSRETFTACIQTMGAVLALSKHLQSRHKIRYLLTGKLMSDPIEARFGMYRQANGGNFYMSVKQLLLAEKKIRCLKDDSPLYDDEYQWLVDFLANVAVEEISDSEAAVAFFVSGYIGRSISRQRKCSHCKGMLVLTDDVPYIHDYTPAKYKEILNMADRGGLSEPTELCFGITLIAVQCYSAISSDSAIMKKLLCGTGNNSRCIFLNALRKIVDASPNLCCVLDAKCKSLHANFDMIVKCAFNCFAKNELKRMNDKPIPDELPQKNLRKIRKLTSKASGKN